MKKIGVLVFLCLSFSLYAQAFLTKVISLQYIPANKAISLLNPLLKRGEVLSGNGQTLVAKVSPETLTQIRSILHQVDVIPVTFTVSVYQGDPQWLSAQNNNTVVYSTQSRSQRLQRQSVKVLSGESAWVNTSQEVPIISSVGAGFFTGIAYQQHTIKNGILLRPTLRGSQVELKVRRIRQQVNPAGGQQFDNQNMDTTLMLPLNQWVSLGSPEGAENEDNSSTSYSAGNTFSQQAEVYVKVSVVGNK